MKRKVLLIEDDPNFRSSICLWLRERFEVIECSSGEDGLDQYKNTKGISLVITDQVLPGLDGIQVLKQIKAINPNQAVIVITAYGSVSSAVEAMREGADDFLQKPFGLSELERTVERVLSFSTSSRGAIQLPTPIITRNQKMINLLKICESIARSDCTVLIEGESGVGKEVIAKAIHAMSPRHSGPCIAINCGAIPENLLESELFGYEKGAFTGADKRKLGKIELAHNGTLILDEISELPLNLQVKLLRVLQERKIERVGGTESVPVDFRLIAISNKSLSALCLENRFRFDLFYRINVIPIRVPPLRERKDDIQPLCEYFLSKFGSPIKRLDDNTLSAIMAYDWPGNVRELQNACERVSVFAKVGGRLSPDMFLAPDVNGLDLNCVGDLSFETVNQTIDQACQDQQSIDDKIVKFNSRSSDRDGVWIEIGTRLDDVEKTLILETLKRCNNNQKRAAEMLGISARTLRNKLAEYRRERVDATEMLNSKSDT